VGLASFKKKTKLFSALGTFQRALVTLINGEVDFGAADIATPPYNKSLERLLGLVHSFPSPSFSLNINISSLVTPQYFFWSS
jgi:hypothetical protein